MILVLRKVAEDDVTRELGSELGKQSEIKEEVLQSDRESAIEEGKGVPEANVRQKKIGMRIY